MSNKNHSFDIDELEEEKQRLISKCVCPVCHRDLNKNVDSDDYVEYECTMCKRQFYKMRYN